MGKLAVLPNIGVRLEEQLNVAGIDIPESLRELGSREAWLKLKHMDPSVQHYTSVCARRRAARRALAPA